MLELPTARVPLTETLTLALSFLRSSQGISLGCEKRELNQALSLAWY